LVKRGGLGQIAAMPRTATVFPAVCERPAQGI